MAEADAASRDRIEIATIIFQAAPHQALRVNQENRSSVTTDCR
jgi:plasmid stabilization system protein ParE